jgi:hypothetical protein
LPEIKFYYEKAPFHQEIKVDGAIGSPSPTGDRIVMSVYTERPAIPRMIVHELSEEGVLGTEVIDRREGKDGIVRVVQTTLHLDLANARALRDWLDHQIATVDDLKGER